MKSSSEPHTPSLPHMTVLASAAVAGGAMPVMLWVWVRMLTPLLGDGRVTLILVLALALFGAWTGAELHAAVRRPTTALALAGAHAATSLAVAVPYLLGDRCAVLALLLQPLGDPGWAWRFLAQAQVAAPAVLPAAMAWGVLIRLPAAISTADGRGPKSVQITVLVAVAIGLLGSAIGSLPPVMDTWRMVMIMLMFFGLEPAVRGWPRRLSWARPLPLVAVALFGLIVFSHGGPTAFWRHSPIGAGLLPTSFDGTNDLQRLVAEQRRSVLETIDRFEQGIALEVSGCGYRTFGVSGGGLRDAPGAAMSALIGAALHPDPKRALVLGLGSGTSAGWLAAVPGIERVDVVESLPEMERVARRCAAINHDAMHHPRVRLHRDDTRDFLRASRQTYDLILAARPLNGRAAARLYGLAARRLNDGGLFLQRLPTDDRIRQDVRAALAGAFESIEGWQVHRDGLVLIAASRPPRHDLERLRSLTGRGPWRDGLDWLWGVEGLEGLYAGYMEDLTRLPLDRATVEDLRTARALAWGFLHETSGDSARLAFQGGDLRRALLDLAGRGEPRSPIDRLLLAEASAELADDRVPRLVAPLRGGRPVEAEAVLARWQARRRSPAAAGPHLLAAFDAARVHPWAHPPTVERALDLAVELAAGDPALGAELFAALAEPFAVNHLAEARQRTRLAIAGLLDDAAACAAAFEDFEPHVPWEEEILRDRLRCYQRSDHRLLERARRDLARFRHAAPPRFDTGLLPEGD